MGMFFARGDGLWTLEKDWAQVDCPLAAIHFAAMAEGHIAAVDNEAHLLCLDGRVLPCDRDIEAMQLWHGHALTLSSNTDCLSVADHEGWLVTARMGMYPQDVCTLRNNVLACGGADGLVHRLTLPDLLPVRTYAVPGLAQRIHAMGETAYVLCTVEDDGLQTLCCRISLQNGRCEPFAALPGLPGAIRSDGQGGLFVGVSEHLYRFSCDGRVMEGRLNGFGLIRHIDIQDGLALVTDPILEKTLLLTRDMRLLSTHEPMVGQAGFIM